MIKYYITKTKIILVLLAVLLLSINSCKSNKETKALMKQGKLSTHHLKNYFGSINNFIDLFEQKKIVQLETIKSCLIGQIDDIIYLSDEKKIIILDTWISKSIFVFTSEGEFLNKIGKKGQGPGEFIIPKSIAYGNNTLVIYSEELLKLLFYNIEGNFIKEISFKEKGWRFAFDKMVVKNNSLYGYTNNQYLNFDSNGDKCKVVKIKDFNDLEKSFGEEENTLDFGEGGIEIFNNSIVFTGLFNGKIYRINPESEKTELFADLGILFNVDDIDPKKTPLHVIKEKYKNLDFIWDIKVFNEYACVIRSKGITLLDKNGNILKNLFLRRIKIPKGFSGVSFRKGLAYYKKGLIFATLDKSKIKGTNVPNPSLIFYEF